MNRKWIAIAVIVVVAFLFLVPVIPTTAPSPAAGFPDIHYYKSISSLFSPVGTSIVGQRYYFNPNPVWHWV